MREEREKEIDIEMVRTSYDQQLNNTDSETGGAVNCKCILRHN